MQPALSTDDVMGLLDELKRAVPKETCWSCDCLQGFVAQLELDARKDVTRLTDYLKVPREQMHGCLGCDPCPPAAAFAEYLRRSATGLASGDANCCADS